jgi:phosphohistidine phosphatase
MELYFLRHGRADRSAWTGSNDFDRPLTDEGSERMAAQAAAMAALNLPLDVILTSPLARAMQTARIAAQELGMEAVLAVNDRLSPGFYIQDLKAILAEHSGSRGMMLVGHEPDFSEMISILIGGGEVQVKKGSLIRVDLDDLEGLSGHLVYSLPPKVLLRMKA